MRDTKDTLVVNAGGAALIPFLRGVSGMTQIAFVILYLKLVNIFSREKLIYIIIVSFIVFFGLFGFVIYPNVDLLHPAKEAITALHAVYPAWYSFIDIYAYWSYSVFYVLAELWGGILYSFIFWEFANHIFNFSEAKRFYGLFAVTANVTLILSGSFVYFCSESIRNYVLPGTDAWRVSIYLLMSAVVSMGVISIYVCRSMYKGVLPDKSCFDFPESIVTQEATIDKPSLIESFKSIIKSPELALIAILIVAYGVAMNLIEVQWKEQLKIFFAGDKGGYNGFLGMYSMATGTYGLIFMIVGIYILRKCSWFTAAVIAPVVVLVGGSLFFTFIVSKDLFQPLLDSFNLKSNAIAVFLGAGVILLSKSVISTLFGPTKEMAYIPLDPELKSKGKAVVDLLVGRFGKAGGAHIQTGLLAAFATKDIISIAPYAFGIFAIVCVVWIYAVKGLSKRIDAAVKLREEESTAA